jgi:hypothetical protein
MQGSLEQQYNLRARARPAADPGRFLIWQDKSAGLVIIQSPEGSGRIPARDAIWIIAEQETKTAREINVPEGLWLSKPMEDTDTLDCWSCGCGCYRDFDYDLAADYIYATLTGEKMFVRDAGIHRLDLRNPGAGWEHVLSGAINRSVLYSSDGCHAAVSDGKVRLVDLCERPVAEP